MKLIEVLPADAGGIWSLVGGGGKTTTMLALVRELLVLGKRVLITTTTKLSAQMPCLENLVLVADESQLKRWIAGNGGSFALLGREVTAEDKIVGIPASWLEDNHRLFMDNWDVVLVEADGSKGKSLKANLAYEPVVPRNSRIVLVIIGLDILGQPLSNHVAHRAELLSSITGTGLGAPVLPATLVNLLLAEQGLLKGTSENQAVYLVLNKYKHISFEQADELAAMLLAAGGGKVKGILLTEMKDKENPLQRVIGNV